MKSQSVALQTGSRWKTGEKNQPNSDFEEVKYSVEI